MKTNTDGTVRKFARAARLPFMALMVALLSCGMGTQPTDFDRDAIIVRAYLGVGQTVNNVQLYHLTKARHDTMIEFIRYKGTAMDTVDTIQTIFSDSMVDNAVVTITTNGVSYPLAFRDSGRYEDASGNLVVTPGQIYRIDIDADGRHVWAQTAVPSSVGGLTASRRTIFTDMYSSSIDTIPVKPKDTTKVIPPDKGKLEKARGKKSSDGKTSPIVDDGKNSSSIADSLTHLTLKWNNPNHDYLYYRLVVDTNLPYPMYFGGNYTTSESLRIFCFTKNYISNGMNKTIDSLSYPLSQLGRYKFILYSTTPEYRNIISDMADTVHQDKWINSPTNINNGVGFFTAFSIDTIYFSVLSAPSGN